MQSRAKQVGALATFMVLPSALLSFACGGDAAATSSSTSISTSSSASSGGSGGSGDGGAGHGGSGHGGGDAGGSGHGGSGGAGGSGQGGSGGAAPDWPKAFGGADLDAPLAVATDASGNILLAGRFKGSIDFGGPALSSAGSDDVFVAKLDSQGNHLWSLSFGGKSTDEPTSLTLDGAGNVFVGGQFSDKMTVGAQTLSGPSFADFLVAIDSEGEHRWALAVDEKAVGQSVLYDVAASPAGDVYIAGSFKDSITFGGTTLTSMGTQNNYLVKFSSLGAPVWVKRVGVYCRGIATDAAGDLYSTGSFNGTVDLGGGAMTAADEDMFWVKLGSADGAYLAGQGYAASGTQTGGTIHVDSAAGILLEGKGGGIDFGGGALPGNRYFAKLSPNGQPVYGKGFSHSSQLIGTPVSAGLAKNGDLLLAGGFDGTLDLGGQPLQSPNPSTFVARLDGAGSPVWSRMVTGVTPDPWWSGVAGHEDGSVLLAVPFTGELSVDGVTLMSAGETDIALLKIQ